MPFNYFTTLSGHKPYFCDYYFLWLNERFDEIRKEANQKEYGFYIEKTLSARSEQKKLTARIWFQTTPLLDINDQNLRERAKDITTWFSAITLWLTRDAPGE